MRGKKDRGLNGWGTICFGKADGLGCDLNGLEQYGQDVADGERLGSIWYFR